jgi:hypothetical protein
MMPSWPVDWNAFFLALALTVCALAIRDFLYKGGRIQHLERTVSAQDRRHECITSQKHMLDQDEAGYCNSCGYQE